MRPDRDPGFPWRALLMWHRYSTEKLIGPAFHHLLCVCVCVCECVCVEEGGLCLAASATDCIHVQCGFSLSSSVFLWCVCVLHVKAV